MLGGVGVGSGRGGSVREMNITSLDSVSKEVRVFKVCDHTNRGLARHTAFKVLQIPVFRGNHRNHENHKMKLFKSKPPTFGALNL